MSSEFAIPPADARTDNRMARAISWRPDEFAWIWLAMGLLIVASAVITPGTLRPSSLLAMLPFASMLAIVGIGQMLTIQQRGLDLSVTGMVALAGILVAQYGGSHGSLVVGIAIALAAAVLVGLLNGLLVTVLSITPLVATLATNALLIAFGRTLSGGFPTIAPAGLAAFSHGKTLGAPNLTILAVLIIGFVAVMMQKSLIGRHFVVVGASPRAATVAGVMTVRYQVATYAAASFCFALTGMLLAGFIGTATPKAGGEYLLGGIAAVVIGGTPFTGGRGSVVATGVAALFMT